MYNYRDYYNYVNDNYNLPLYDKQNQLYDTYNGFIRGNIFPQLYNNYMELEPFKITPSNEQAKLLTDIDSLTFYLIDLNLYLDMHPDNKDAINIYNRTEGQLNIMVGDYQKKYGPLFSNNNYFDNKWTWNNSPWPWEN